LVQPTKHSNNTMANNVGGMRTSNDALIAGALLPALG
jgi:hypothetical protein